MSSMHWKSIQVLLLAATPVLTHGTLCGGRPDMRTFVVVESEDQSFSESVKRHVGDLRFEPAQLNGSPVPQMVDLAFDFGIDDAPARREIQQYGNNLIVVRATGVHR